MTPRWTSVTLLVLVLTLGLNSSNSQSAELAIRGFHLGMTIPQVDRLARREFGQGIIAGPVDTDSIFFRPSAGCGVSGDAAAASAAQVKELSKLADVRTMTVDGDKVVYDVTGEAALSRLNDQKVDSLVFPGCVFGVDDSKAIFAAVEAIMPIPAACHRLLPNKNGDEQSFCYKDGKLLSFVRRAETGRYTFWLTNPEKAKVWVERAKEAGVTK